MILENLIPVYSIILLGNILRRWNIINNDFIGSAKKILDTYLLPILIFWFIAQQNGQYLGVSKLVAIFTIIGLFLYLLIHLYIVLFKISASKAILLFQSCYRFNAYIGLGIAQGFDKSVLRDLCIFIGFALPVIDVITVLIFSKFSPKTYSFNEIIQLILRRIISKPLLPACIIGIISSAVNFHWPLLLINLFQIIVPVIVPLSLIVIGGSLSFTALSQSLRFPIIGSLFKFIVLPSVGYFLIGLFILDTITIKTILILLMLPCNITSPSKSRDMVDQANACNTLSIMLSFIFIMIIIVIF